MTALAPTLQAFFTNRLTNQYGVSPHTVQSYRDAFKLLLSYAFQATRTSPAALDISQLDTTLITGFLDDLEHRRGNTIRTRNARLAAIHSFATYASYRHPEHAAVLSKILAIPRKRHQVTDIAYLNDAEVDALLAAPDPNSWIGRRDHALLHVAVATGMRVGELAAITGADVHLGAGAHITCHGKGRKDRTTPLAAAAVRALRRIDMEMEKVASDAFVFTTRAGKQLSRDAIAARLNLHTRSAARTCPTIGDKKVTPHVLRHTCAMRLLTAGIDIAVIALWLGHDCLDSTKIYIHADMRMKENALNRTAPLNTPSGRYVAPDDLLAFLNSL